MKSMIPNHPFRAWLAAMILLGLLAATQACTHPPAGAKPGAPKIRIGVYDSRAVVMAYGGSEMLAKKMRALMAEYNAAKAAGDRKKIAELEAQGPAMQYRLHLQGFSTAPVDDILAQIEDQLPVIERQAGVSGLVSKWDEKALANNKDAEKIDVTPLLVDAFKVSPERRAGALDIQKQKPMPLAKAEKYFKEHPED